MTSPQKRPPDQERSPDQPVAAPQPQPQPLADQLQSTVGNAAVGTLFGRAPGVPPPPGAAVGAGALVPYTGLPELPRFSSDPIHVDPTGVVRPAPELPRFSRDPIHVDATGVAQPGPPQVELPRFSSDPIHLDTTGAVQPQPPLPTVSGAPIFLDPAGGAHTRRDVERDRARLNDALDTALATVFARRRALLQRGQDLKLPGVAKTVKKTQYPVAPNGPTTDLIAATQQAVAESGWLDTRLADLQPARWDVAFATPLTEVDDRNWRGLKTHWTALAVDLAAVAAAMSLPAAPPPDFPDRVGRLNVAYLKYISYPRLKELYGDRLAGTGLREGVPTDLTIGQLRVERPDVFLVDDPGLYRTAYEEVKLMMRRGLVPLSQLNSTWGGTSPTQRYLPKVDLQHASPTGTWGYHLSAEFGPVEKAPAWRRIRTVHVTFRLGGAAVEPRYWWTVDKGELRSGAASGGGHEAWMGAAAKALVTARAKDIDCRPPP